jgi:predicted Rossmann-fold nucleotide-binding protein
MTIEQFIEEYSVELIAGTAVYFVGAGISKPSKLPDWAELLMPHALKIDITKLKDKNLPLIAQYVINEETGNRGPFINSISRKLRKKYSPNSYHESIVKTNIKTIWTTNYDVLLETAFGNHISDVKVNDEAISRDVPDVQVEIIKMHGCIFNSHRDDIVITESDYEDFFIKRPATAQRLKIDLLQKSFLFIGYGYGDPNIKNIITEARRLASNATRQHYLIAKKQDGSEFKLWCNNLKRYGIRVIEIAEHNELDLILEKLSLKSRGKSVFITGSHSSKNTNPDVQEISEALAKEEDIILNDGQSTGVMRLATRTFTEKVIEQKADINKRLKFYPNPYAANPSFANDASLIPILKQWRLLVFKATQIVVAFDGGMGTQAEIEKALELGCIVIPFFKDKKGFLWKLLDETTLIDRIEKYDKNYIKKVKDAKVTATDVINLTQSILNTK